LRNNIKRFKNSFESYKQKIRDDLQCPNQVHAGQREMLHTWGRKRCQTTCHWQEEGMNPWQAVMGEIFENYGWNEIIHLFQKCNSQLNIMASKKIHKALFRWHKLTDSSRSAPMCANFNHKWCPRRKKTYILHPCVLTIQVCAFSLFGVSMSETHTCVHLNICKIIFPL